LGDGACLTIRLREDGMNAKRLVLTCALIGSVGCKDMAGDLASASGPTALVPAGHESACGTASPRAPWSGEECYDPVIDADDFAGVAEDNPFFPLEPGTLWRYEAETKDGAEINTVEVTFGTKTIHLPDGSTIEATVVHDLVYECEDLDDCDLVLENLIEETFDWYAQDDEGTVWYFGEDSREFDGGVPVSTEGSWEAYVDGALPGIVMLADPTIGATYRQEFSLDVAQDLARVVSLNRSVSVPFDDFEGCLKTQDWNALEPASQEQKFYCPGIGTVLEIGKQNEHVELVDVELAP